MSGGRVWSDPTRRRWVIWGALASVFLLVNVYRLSTAVLAEQLTRAFDATATELGTLHAAFFYVYAPLQLVAGVLADRVGIRRTATAGAVVMNVGAVAFALGDSYALAFAARALIGIGGSVVFIATLRFCANWFRPREFATMNGLTIAIAGLGGVVATTPLALAVAAVGWRTAVASLAALGLALAAGVAVLARDTPAAAGLDPLAGVPEAATLSLGQVVGNARQVLGETETWLVGLVLFCGTGLNITVIGLWGVPYVVQVYDVSVTRASVYTLLGSLGLMVGPPAVGRLSDAVGRRTDLVVLGVGLYAALFGGLAFVGDPPLWTVGAGLFAAGFLTGAWALTYAVVKERHAAAASGVATGTVNAAAFLGAALFPTLMGVVLDAYVVDTVAGSRAYSLTGYRLAFGLAAGAAGVALVAAIVLHRRTSSVS